MGFNEGQIVLDRPNGTYYSGQTIRGNLVFEHDTVKTIRGLYLKFSGFCMVYWKTTETRSVGGRNVSVSKNHESYEEYVNKKLYVVGGESGEHQLRSGHHDYPFTFQIPANCPSSFQGEYGLVRYEIHAVADRAYNVDKEKKVVVRVVAPLDLNMDPYCKEPLLMELNNSYCCCYFSSGSTETVINAPVSGYCPGQKIPIEITCSNKGNVKIKHIKIRIVKNTVFLATTHPDTRSNKDVIAEIKKKSIPGNTTRNWVVDLEVPAIYVYNMSGCRFIDMDYKLEVEVSPGGCHSDTEDKRKIIIGTIPLVGFQDNFPNPQQDQMPQQTAAVTQPLSSRANLGTGNTPRSKKSPNPPRSNTANPPPYPSDDTYSNDPPPYPGISSPNPTQQRNIGFTVQGSNVPTSPANVTPHMAASAPIIDSNDTEKL